MPALTLTPGQILELVRIQNMPDRSSINPQEYFGMQSWVQKMVDDPVKGMQDLLKASGIAWDGNGKYWLTISEEVKKQCRVSMAVAHMNVEDRREDDAREILAYNKAIPGVLSSRVVEQSQEVALKAADRNVKERLRLATVVEMRDDAV